MRSNLTPGNSRSLFYWHSSASSHPAKHTDKLTTFTSDGSSISGWKVLLCWRSKGIVSAWNETKYNSTQWLNTFMHFHGTHTAGQNCFNPSIDSIHNNMKLIPAVMCILSVQQVVPLALTYLMYSFGLFTFLRFPWSLSQRRSWSRGDVYDV